MITSEARPVNYRGLMKKVEQVVAAMDRDEDVGARPSTRCSRSSSTSSATSSGIYGGRLYQRRGAYYVLQATFGDAKEVPQGLKVPLSYRPIQLLLEEGAVYMDADDPRHRPQPREPARRAASSPPSRWATRSTSSPSTWLPATTGTTSSSRSASCATASTRRSAATAWRGSSSEARKIQASILPRRSPAYGDFDISGRSEPMEEVGGDFFDYIPVTEKILGLAIADVSGHGLPAALQVRDIYMGLRMGLARDFKIVRTVERMNNIIHQSTLTSRFVSMFYGELELNGVFIYVNAGHPPPFHLAADGTVRYLEEGGPVLGPLPGATYERGFVIMKPGDMLVFYTDGICETQGRDEEGRLLGEYGIDRLLEVAREHQGETAREVVDAIFASVEAFSRDAPADDDRTRDGGQPPGDRHLGDPGVPAADGSAVIGPCLSSCGTIPAPAAA